MKAFRRVLCDQRKKREGEVSGREKGRNRREEKFGISLGLVSP